jgi:hypothetical protein
MAVPIQPVPVVVKVEAPEQPAQPTPVKREVSKGRRTAAIVTGIIGCVFAGLGALWSFLGGACCGWAAWPEAALGIILAIVSLCLRRSALGWVALGLGIFAFAWVIIFYLVLGGALAGTAAALSGGMK